MKVILLKDIEKLGRKNDIKKVANGYARNFLLPKNLAVLANKAEMENLKKIKEEEARLAEEELIRYQEIAGQLDGIELEIAVKVDENEKLFGSVNALRISEKLKENGFEVDKNQIKIKEPIKDLGEHEVDIVFPHNLEAKIKVIITALE